MEHVGGDGRSDGETNWIQSVHDTATRVLKRAATFIPGQAQDQLTSARDHTPRPDASPEWPQDATTGFRSAATSSVSKPSNLLKQVQDRLQEPRVGLMHVGSRLLLQATVESSVSLSGVPLGGLDPEAEPSNNLHDLDVASSRWKLEVYGKYTDGFPRALRS